MKKVQEKYLLSEKKILISKIIKNNIEKEQNNFILTEKKGRLLYFLY
jgi:hypothetical protein